MNSRSGPVEASAPLRPRRPPRGGYLAPFLSVLAATTLAGACSASGGGVEGSGGGPPPTPGEPADPTPSADTDTGSDTDSDTDPVPDPATVEANELGSVPVLMYHQLVEEPAGVYDRTPEDFRAELERLAEENYVPVTAGEYSRGEIDIPAGTHPVVLTFDDSTNSQFALDDDGKPIPDSAVGILLEVAERHPGFRPTATFFVNDNAFSATGAPEALPWLTEHGFEIGNHTLGHAHLGQLTDEEVQREIAGNAAAIAELAPGTEVTSLALPFGVMPTNAALAVEGESDGHTYRHDGVHLVGANPAPSPFADAFDAGAIPRIRSAGPDAEDAEYGSARWLDRLGDGTIDRYTSDGNPDTIAFPEEYADRLAEVHRDRAHPY
ncbi:polysaccharide deacetylase family protein [Streptomyces alkaliphilus]|uniref:polysaccharide deacetylase family protein n=1 Tax=Streptomyces alkaliphilus TaxID=1472722 RepID=UPI0011807F8E|nr:polysaccharide deacetylase family protein [Streptomyces alkaliphilus]MQS06815.1 polysaccharide deacetylase family protein [Streptomyces alkaliphilus]